MYFNDHAFQKYNGINSNYIDIETGEEYWISGIKKKESNRHWVGSGCIMIDSRAVDDYLLLVGESTLSKTKYKIIEIKDEFPVERIKQLLNSNGG